MLVDLDLVFMVIDDFMRGKDAEDLRFDIKIGLREKLKNLPIRKITPEQAKEIIENIIFRKELGLDVTCVFKDLQNGMYFDLMDSYIRQKQKLLAIKMYREITSLGLSDAKIFVEERARQLGLQI